MRVVDTTKAEAIQKFRETYKAPSRALDRNERFERRSAQWDRFCSELHSRAEITTAQYMGWGSGIPSTLAPARLFQNGDCVTVASEEYFPAAIFDGEVVSARVEHMDWIYTIRLDSGETFDINEVDMAPLGSELTEIESVSLLGDREAFVVTTAGRSVVVNARSVWDAATKVNREVGEFQTIEPLAEMTLKVA